MKVLINVRFGGYSLSPLAIKQILKRKGKECHFFSLGLHEKKEELTLEEATNVFFGFITYIVPNPHDFDIEKADKDGLYKSANKRSEKISANKYIDSRTDEIIIDVVEKLGEKANGSHALLKIVEIPDGVKYTIEEYDGFEHIAEIHRTWG